eukprot:scaffold65165_cov63-Phaeocystis_antarctica.AAC.1
MGCGVDDVAGDVVEWLTDGRETQGQLNIADAARCCVGSYFCRTVVIVQNDTIRHVLECGLRDLLATNFDVQYRLRNGCKRNDGRHIAEKLGRVSQEFTGATKKTKGNKKPSHKRVERVAGGQAEDPLLPSQVPWTQAVQQVDHAP